MINHHRAPMHLLKLSLVSALLIAILGCKGREPDPLMRENRLVVFAAASLREAFTTMGTAFEHTQPGIQITFNFVGTQELRTQIEHGASADVFASADRRHMDELVQAGRVQKSFVFARNEIVIVVTKEREGFIRSISDLPAVTRIVIGAPEVPIGRYTLQVLDRASMSLGSDFRARVEAAVVSHEFNVRQVLAKVSMGEAQAGFVYRTDVQAAQDAVAVVTIPSDVNVMAEYPIAVLTDVAHPGLAHMWIAFVLSDAGQSTLRNLGFLGTPERGSEP